MFRHIIHYSLHFGAPALAARLYRPKAFKKTWALMLLPLAIDLDHFLATPLFDPDRCSLFFHPLHSAWALAIYILLLAIPSVRVLAIGLLIHLGVDGLDCFLMHFHQ